MIETLKIEDIGSVAKIDYKEIYNKSLVSFDEELRPQPIAISFGESEYKNNMYPVPFGTYGNFSAIIGHSKSTKSFLKSLIMACCMGGDSNIYASHIKSHKLENKYLIDIDTEQSEYHAQRVFRRSVEMAGYVSEFYKCFSLRELLPEQRRDFVRWLIYESQYAGKIGILSIDGVADLVNNVNDIEESNLMVGDLLKWTKENNIHIINIIHLNFGTTKPTGHLGSSIIKKAETICLVKREDGISYVVPQDCRNIPFDDFDFEINKNNWLPYVGSISKLTL